MNRSTRTPIAALACMLCLLAGCAQVAMTAAAHAPRPAGKSMGKGKRVLHTQVDVPEGRQVATLAGGCFWCTEAVFAQLKGVDRVVPGYAGGSDPNPSYKQVCTGATGHAEAVQIVFDPAVIAYRDLVRIFFTVHDPTTLDRQGADVGTQYRSAIFTHSEAQQREAREVIAEVDREGIWGARIVTEVTPFTCFYAAEDYHRDYFTRNPAQGYCQVVIAPKVAKFREKYAARLKP